MTHSCATLRLSLTVYEWETDAHKPHRSMQKTLSMIAERVEFKYEDSLNMSEPGEAHLD